MHGVHFQLLLFIVEDISSSKRWQRDFAEKLFLESPYSIIGARCSIVTSKSCKSRGGFLSQKCGSDERRFSGQKCQPGSISPRCAVRIGNAGNRDILPTLMQIRLKHVFLSLGCCFSTPVGSFSKTLYRDIWKHQFHLVLCCYCHIS